MDASIRSRSIILSVLIHGLLLLILFLVAMSIPIPPFPETGGGGGVLVSIGNEADAFGDVQPTSPNITENPAVNKVKPAPQPEENIATQETEESPIAHEKKDPKKEVKPVKTVVNTVKETNVPPTPVRTADRKALYQGPSNASASQGTTHGTGDQGDPKGDPNSKYTGTNGPGNGPGSGPGTGPGSGGGKGGGVSFSLAGRQMLRTPSISDRSQETGKVVVDITVNKDGNVVAANAGGRGSTTTSAYLYKLAQEAAMKAKFSPSPNAADIQKGTITFVFLVQ